MRISVIICVRDFESLANGFATGAAETTEEPKFELGEDPKTTPF